MIWAEPALVNDPAVAVKLAVVAPEAGVMDAGTETFALLELSAMAAPGAGLLKVTTQVDCPFGFNDAGVQLKAETWASAVRDSGAEAVVPLSEAVIWAELSVVNDPAVAVKLAVVAAGGGRDGRGHRNVRSYWNSAQWLRRERACST